MDAFVGSRFAVYRAVGRLWLDSVALVSPIIGHTLGRRTPVSARDYESGSNGTMGKRIRRTNPARDVFKRLCLKTLGDADFHEAVDRARHQHEITPKRFPEDMKKANWPEHVKGDMGEFLKTVERIQERWFPRLPDEYYFPIVTASPYGAAFTFVCWALCYDLETIPTPIPIPIPAKPMSTKEGGSIMAIPYLSSICDLVAPFLFTFMGVIGGELRDLRWSQKQVSAFLKRIRERYLSAWGTQTIQIRAYPVDSEISRWLRNLEDLGFGAPVLKIPPLVTSEQYRSWWPGIERARDSAYGKSSLPRQRRAGPRDAEIARLWAEGRSEAEIVKVLSSDEEDLLAYDAFPSDIRAVVRSIPRRKSAASKGRTKKHTRRRRPSIYPIDAQIGR